MKSVAMMKLEKNCLGIIDKKYPRKPYLEYPIFNRDNPSLSLIGFIRREMIELEVSLDILYRHKMTVEKGNGVYAEVARDVIPEAIHDAKLEIADVSNTLDYLFEGLLELEV